MVKGQRGQWSSSVQRKMEEAAKGHNLEEQTLVEYSRRPLLVVIN
jgi:hypothetical protein